MERPVTMNEHVTPKFEFDEKDERGSTLKAIIFDMDGTLIESTRADYLAWEKTFADFGRQLPFKDYQPLLGIKSADVVKKVLGVTDEDEIKKSLAAKHNYFKEIVSVDKIQPVKGAKELLEELRKTPVRLALATSSRREKMKLIMTDLGFINYFDVIVTGDEVINSKPAPDIFLLAAERLGLSVDECVVVEDAVNGVKSAKSADMKCVAITTTHTREALYEADLVIDSFDEVNFYKVVMQLM